MILGAPPLLSKESPGLLRRLLTALGGALHRGILGKTNRDYMKQFNGSDEYWRRATAAHSGWVQNQPPKPDPNCSRGAGNAATPAGPDVGGAAGLPPEPEFEPVHGWTKRQLDEYLARNPAYRSTYDAELQKHHPKDEESKRCGPKNYERRPKSKRGHTNIRRRSRKMQRFGDIKSGLPNG